MLVDSVSSITNHQVKNNTTRARPNNKKKLRQTKQRVCLFLKSENSANTLLICRFDRVRKSEITIV